jgi:maleamate amidohydrolase
VAADGSSAGLWRYKQRYHAEGRVQIEDSRAAAIIDELAPQPGDRVIRKWRPSAFFRTDFEVLCSSMCWRSTPSLVCGTSVSGCVRATVTDAFMRDIRCMVVRECVADRTRAVLDANLFDMDQKYADVVTLKDALDYLHAFPLKNSSSERMRPACSIAFPLIWRRFR